MGSEDRGSGVTFVEIWKSLVRQSAIAYREQLDAMGSGFKKKQKDDLVAGFEDGMRMARVHLEGMGVIVVKEGGG